MPNSNMVRAKEEVEGGDKQEKTAKSKVMKIKMGKKRAHEPVTSNEY